MTSKTSLLDDALAAYRQLLPTPSARAAESPALGHFNYGFALNGAGRFAEALVALNLARDCGLVHADLFHSRGIALFNLHRAHEALADFDQALPLAPPETAANIHNTRGFVLQSLGRWHEAHQSYQSATQLNPGLAIAQLNKGINLLGLGQWADGWEGYEWRWHGAHEASTGGYRQAHSPLPQWDGKPVDPSARLLVFAEQGLGDTLLCARYLRLAAALFARVSVVTPPALVRLLQTSCGPQVEVLAHMPADHAAWTWQCPAMSLPRAFKARPDDGPPQPPYLQALPEDAARWRERVASLRTERARRTVVGLVWAGAAHLKEDAARSIALNQLSGLLQTPNVAFISLQTGTAAGQAAPWTQAGQLADWTAELHDFADTAALVAALDLVISVDTAVAHLAGGLGTPVWMLNRFNGDWRWLRDRSDSPWYPSMRIFNQSAPGDWSGALAQVQTALASQSTFP
jgi:hypothetical protein